MHFEGETIINTSREKVWEYVSDPRNALEYVPLIKSLEVHSDKRFSATIGVGVGSIRGSFALEFEIVKEIPPAHTRIKASGSGIKSVVDFETRIDFAEASDYSTSMKWEAEVKVGGLLPPPPPDSYPILREAGVVGCSLDPTPRELV